MAREKNTGGKEKEAFYFTHDYNARNDLKMQEMMMDMGCEYEKENLRLNNTGY